MTMLPEDIELMADYLGRDNPPIKRLLQAYHHEPQMKEAVYSLLRRRCIKAGFDPDELPIFWPVSKLPKGDIKFGHVFQGATPGPEFSLSSKGLTQHSGVFGHNGTGKSFLSMNLALQAINEGLHVWMFDIEDEYSRLIPLLPSGKVIAIEPEQLRLNFFQPPGDWIASATWIDELNLLLRGATFLRDGSLNLFGMGMAKLLKHKERESEGASWPSLSQTIEYFHGLGFGPKARSAGYLESLLNRFSTLAESFKYTTNVTQSNILQILSDKSVVFRLNGLTGIPLQFLVSYLLLWLARFKEGASNHKPHIVVLEEAHMLASEKSRQDIGESVLCRMFRTARKRNIGLVLCDQVPSELPPAILGNLACRIVMRLTNAKCIWSLQSSMGLSKNQTEMIAALEPRRAVVQYSLYPRPFVIEVPEIEFPPKPPQEVLNQQSQILLSEVMCNSEDMAARAVMPSSAKLLVPDDLVGDALIVMIRICEQPAELIEQRCQALRIDRAREFRARAELDARGLINKNEQTIGGKVKFFEPTDKGIAWAQKRNIQIKKFKSGIVHEYILSQVERCIGFISPRWRLQRNSSIAKDYGLEPDLLALEPSGKRIIVEICCNNLDYDAKNFLIEAKIPDVDLVVAITTDKKARHLLEDVLKRSSRGLDENQKKNIVLLDAGECLADQFDWEAVLANGNHGT